MQNGITLLFSYLLLSLPLAGFAQSETASINGQVLDPENAPVAFANVVLYRTADSSMAKVEYTDDKGAFLVAAVPAGEYRLDISYVGLPPYRSERFQLEAGETREFQTIRMKSAATELEEVVVTADRPLLELKPDKVVLNVENTINAVGNNALELLRKSPGVLVDNNGTLSLLGRTGVRIYIDGKPSPLRGNDLTSYLQSLQSTDIDAIEIITNPGARYDAEGNAGIINIRLKKDKNLGANGNVNLGYSIGEVPRYNSSISGNFRNRTFNLFGNYSYNEGYNRNYMDLYREQLGFRLDQTSVQGGDWGGHNFKAGADLFLDKQNTVGIMIDGNLNKSNWGGRSRTEIGMTGTPEIDSILIATTADQSDNKNFNFNLNYRFDNAKGTIWNIDGDYGLYRNYGEQYQPNKYVDPSEEIILSERNVANEKPTNIDMYTFKVDHERTLGPGKLGAGLKLAYVQTDNTFRFYNIVDGEPILNEKRSNNFVYQENVNAAYLNYSQQLKKLSFQVGLRTEQTNSVGDLTSTQVTENENVERHYLDFFPTASLSYQAGKKNSFQLSYGRRINRPSYQDLNPFRDQLDELTYQQGNPFLRPEYTNNVQLTHSFNSMLNTTLRYSHTTDLITRQTDTSGTTSSFITWLNLAEQHNYSVNVSAPVSFTKWWNSYTSLTGYYTRNQGNFGEGKSIDLDAKAFNIYSQHTFKLPADFTLEISGWYNSPSLWGGNFEMDAMWSMDAGIQKKLFNGRANLKLSVTDIFRTNEWHGVSQFGPLYLDVNGGWDSRRFRVNFSYLFGNTQVKGARRRNTGLADEQSRVKSGNN